MASEVEKDLTDWHQVIPVVGSGGPVKAAQYLANQKAAFEAKSAQAVFNVTQSKIAAAQEETQRRQNQVIFWSFVGAGALMVAGVFFWRGLRKG